MSEIIVECAIKCVAHHVINPNDLLDLLGSPQNSSSARALLFFHEKLMLAKALFIVFHYYLSMGKHFKLEEWKVNMVVLLLSLQRGRDLYLTRGIIDQESSVFARKLYESKRTCHSWKWLEECVPSFLIESTFTPQSLQAFRKCTTFQGCEKEVFPAASYEKRRSWI